ncbi:MAG: hypothetical protein IJX14_09785 [Clostridia bacterium]|nr:hypothetical protein [Clostridia bacterium]
MSYLITHWCDVPAKFFSEERIREVIDCGINLVMGAYDVEMNRKALFNGVNFVPCGKTVKLEAGGGALLRMQN